MVVAALLVGGLVLGARFLLLDSGLLAVHDVEVVGASAVATEAVLAAVAVEPGTPLVAVDTAAVAGRVAGVPGVGSADVSRAWPSTLVVRITERTAVAVSAGPSGRRLVDATGLAYAQAPDPPPALPSLEVAAPAPDDPSTLAALRVLAALPDAVRRDLVAVGAGSPDAVTLRLTGDRTVRWGSAEDSARKAAVLVPLLTRPGAAYDVASPDLPTVRR